VLHLWPGVRGLRKKQVPSPHSHPLSLTLSPELNSLSTKTSSTTLVQHVLLGDSPRSLSLSLSLSGPHLLADVSLPKEALRAKRVGAAPAGADEVADDRVLPAQHCHVSRRASKTKKCLTRSVTSPRYPHFPPAAADI
jgi:hypothetical protein